MCTGIPMLMTCWLKMILMEMMKSKVPRRAFGRLNPNYMSARVSVNVESKNISAPGFEYGHY